MKIGGQVVSTQIQAITRETVASQQGKSTTSVCSLSAPEVPGPRHSAVEEADLHDS